MQTTFFFVNLCIQINDNAKLARLLTHLNALYKNPNNKRGRHRHCCKTLFGTMDVDDERIINEQLNLLANNEQTLQHAIKNNQKS